MTSVFDVFVVGGVPSATYNPRDARRLARDLENIARGRHTLGAVHGPTKCGKSVLIAKTLPDAVKLEGVSLKNVDSLWWELASRLGISAEERSSFEYRETGSSETSGGLNAGVADLTHSGSDAVETTRGRQWSAPKSVPQRVIERLQETNGVVVIDDFHHAREDVRREIVRVLKGMLFDGVPIILASVSHHAYDAAIAEPEMEGRLEIIAVPTWDVDELATIGREGFAALNVEVDERVLSRLADEALGSPQLMQLFCLNFCLSHDIREEQDQPSSLPEPEWPALFGDIARRSPAVSRLTPIKLGPKERGHQRDRMKTRDGAEVDIYGAILLAVSTCGPTAAIPYRDLKAAINNVLAEGSPNATQIKNTLSQQSAIAESLVEGRDFVDPVIHWDGDTLFVVDPFFSFFVRWGDLGVERA
jgi:hypothetical protein